MSRRKVCVVVTARPSYSRVKTALQAIKSHESLELQLVVAASALLDRYGTVVRYMEEDGFDVAARVFMVLEGENLTSMAKTTGLGLMELATVFDNLRPDIVVTIADRYETIATAIAAAYMNIPVLHVQGGEVTGSIDEKVRHAVTKLSDFHFAASAAAARRLISMGEEPETVFHTGCPSIDLATETVKTRSLGFDPFEKYGGVGERIDYSQGHLVVLQHPVTTEYELARQHVEETIAAVNEIGLPTFWFWPNVDAGSDGTSKGIRHFRETMKPRNIHFFKNMEPADFLQLVYHGKCLVGNSSMGIRECAFLGTPVVNIGSRQEGRDRGHNVRDSGYDRTEIAEAIRMQLANGRYASDPIYGTGDAGIRFAELLSTIPLRTKKRLTY